MKSIFVLTLFSILFSVTPSLVFAEEIESRDIPRIRKYNLISRIEEDYAKIQIEKSKERIPKSWKEKISDLRAGGDKKAFHCIEIKHFYKHQQIKLNAAVQVLIKTGLMDRISRQRKDLFLFEYGEYKREALKALEECRTAKISVDHQRKALNFLIKSRMTIKNGLTFNGTDMFTIDPK